MKPADWVHIVETAGFSLNETQLSVLTSYRDWLRWEAIPAGGLGPGESGRLDERHIADSLSFSLPFSDRPLELADLGTGVGLPGIPLSILWPETSVTLLDRSARRVDLARRACRVLDLQNVEVNQRDIAELDTRYPAVVSRAAIPPRVLAGHVRRVLSPGGLAVVGGSWEQRPNLADWDTYEIPTEMLDRRVWLLIMRRQ